MPFRMKTKKDITAPDEIGYKAKCDLTFKAETNVLCVAQVNSKTSFILSNVPYTNIDNKENVTPIYGGIKQGHIFVKMEQTADGTNLNVNNNSKERTFDKTKCADNCSRHRWLKAGCAL